MPTESAYPDLSIGPLTVLYGYDNGKYPQGNSLLVRGRDETAIIDPSLGVVARRDRLPDVDLVLHSHVHEDHMAGSYLFQDARWFAHVEDVPGLLSLSGMMDIYGWPEPVYSQWQKTIVEKFNYVAKPDAIGFQSDRCFDLGGVTVTALHTPGHTRGHCCFLIEWNGSDDRLIFLGDIELSGFGPYYGDAWSDLEDFEHSLEKLKSIQARWWLTFHHKGLLDGRAQFLPMLDRYASVIERREERLLTFLREDHSLSEIVTHRIVYRPQDTAMMIDPVEARSISMHLAKLVRMGKVRVLDENRYQAI